MNSNSERQKRVRFAVGMAAIDGEKPTAFTQNLLKQYENGKVSESKLKKAILDKYTNYEEKPFTTNPDNNKTD